LLINYTYITSGKVSYMTYYKKKNVRPYNKVVTL